ncbi:MAG: gluconate transporter [Bacteroidales bacterium]|nr:gluconate transporter [Bacteroidales bacterium]
MDTTRLVIAAVIGLIVLLALIIRFKLPAMIAILVGAVLIGLGAGMSFDQIIGAVDDGIGNTLKGIALLVGLGSMFGSVLEISGGAQALAVTMVDKFGERKAAWALAITGLVIAMPVFFDAGLIILIPLAFSLAKRTGRSSLYYAIPLLAGLAVGHAFIPPTPGPVLVATMLGVDLGWVILIGALCGVVAMIVAGPVWGSWCGKKYHIPAPDRIVPAGKTDKSKIPSFWTVVIIILIPLVLIILKSVAGVVEAFAPARGILGFLGEPFVALTLATLTAMILLGYRNGYSKEELEKVMTKSLEPVGLILLVTACGGVLRYILQYSGLGEVIGGAVASASLPIVVVAFVVAALVRISVGSATVAMTMAAGMVASMPEIASLSPIHLACVTAAIAGGATVCSHFNDSGFWLVKSLLGMDEKTTLKTWTVMETLVGCVGFLVALVISLFC